MDSQGWFNRSERLEALNFLFVGGGWYSAILFSWVNNLFRRRLDPYVSVRYLCWRRSTYVDPSGIDEAVIVTVTG